jgi:uncharacterized membrane protein HdeD (DUF308 family)
MCSSNIENARMSEKEGIQHLSVQASILAGFAFTGLTVVTYEVTTPPKLIVAFSICASIAITLELLALFISALVLFSGTSESMVNKYNIELVAAWVFYVLGLISFLAALILLSWLRVRPAAIPITVIGIVAVIAMLAAYYRIVVRDNSV